VHKIKVTKLGTSSKCWAVFKLFFTWTTAQQEICMLCIVKF